MPQRLTPRELEVARAVADGLAYSEIADKLKIGLETVNSHARAIRKKLSVKNKVQITNWVREHESAS